MKTKIVSLTMVVAFVLAFAGPVATADPPTLEEQIETSVVAGLEWLASQQNGDGSFGIECDSIARTGLAVLKFEDRAIDLGLMPLDPEYEYVDVVQDGLDYIESHAHTVAIGLQPAGDPDGNDNGVGVYWIRECEPSPEVHHMYNTSLAMMALAASGDPGSYGLLVQDAVDFMAFAQEDIGCEPHRGGWRYTPNQCSSDNSNSGYVTLGLGYAAAPPPLGFGLTIPEFVKTELSLWIDVIQDDANGGSWYDPGTAWINTLKTGNLLYEMGLVGDTVITPRVQHAIDYMEQHWNDADDFHPHMWQDHRQAMFAMMKGFEALGVELLDLDDDTVPEYDWFLAFAQHLIVTQNGDGSWPGDPWAGPIESTAWALLTLEKAVPIFAIEVPFDIKPEGCHNPMNVEAKGVLPTAILGTEEFDVTQIDPATVRLVNLVDPDDTTLHVAPLRWAYEDVATPYEPYLGKEDAFDCTTAGPDGYLDLTVKFSSQEVATALGTVADGDVLVLTVIGNLMEEFGGTPIVGEDVVVILSK